MSHYFVIFSNTIEEYEAFINAGVFYWPREITKLTRYQREINGHIEIKEELGDRVAIVVGAKIKNIKDEYLKSKIINTPMITHIAEVSEVYERPVLGFRYTHGRNPSSSFMLPFEFFPEFKKLETYLGRSFTSNDLSEIENAIELGKCIEELLGNNEIEFTRAYFKDNEIFIQAENQKKVYELTTGFPKHEKTVKSINESLTFRQLPTKESLIKIIDKCNSKGLDGEKLILSLRTWRGSEFMKLNISEETFLEIEGKLQEGISTRLISSNEDSDRLLIDIKKHLVDLGTEDSNESECVQMIFPKNSILYGPPGTGKTYNTINYAVSIIENKSFDEVKGEDYPTVFERYNTYKKQGQIGLVTFHQSYGYEEFIEGIKPLLNEELSGEVVYKIDPGAFKEFCENAQQLKIVSGNKNLDLDTRVWKVSLGGSGDNGLKGDCFKNNRIRIGWDDLGKELTEETEYPNASVQNILTNFYDEMSIGDIIFSLGDQKHIDAIGIVTEEPEWLGDEKHYKRSRKVEWLAKNIWEYIYELNGKKNLTLATVYELKRLSIEDVNQLILKHSQSTNTDVDIEENKKNYIFIIDEINRGNISKIFGELITLIEPTKRLGATEETKVKLPYSKKEFGVPQNVYLLGTMNTADRSIALMDTALRRRFNFIEMMPDTQVLAGIVVETIDIQKMVEIINQRIEVLYDRDHTIGHAYFMSLEAEPYIEKLASIFKNAIIPLLQEYFYEDYSKIQLVLGDNAKESDFKFILDENLKVKDIFKGNLDVDLPEKKYKTQSEAFMKPQSYIGIYE